MPANRAGRFSTFDLLLALAAGLAIVVAVWQLRVPYADLDVRSDTVGATPVTIYQRDGAEPAPAVVIAHGFAGSQQLMQPFAITLAQNGYLAITFDFLGHGRNPEPMRGDVTKESGATRALVAQLGHIVAFARDQGGSDGRVALLGHSMASDIVVRAAQADPEVAATIAVSMFSPAVTASSPGNLLIIVGGWEQGLKAEALRVVDMVTDQEAEEGVTYGRLADGDARRTAFSDGVEHIGVLYSEESLAEALAWLNATFDRSGSGQLTPRGLWLVLLLLAIIVLARPLSRLLPQVTDRPVGAPLPRRTFYLLAFGPAVLTPLLLWLVQVAFLPILVADYLAQHFALYGLLTAAGLWLTRPAPDVSTGRVSPVLLILGALAVAGYGIGVLGQALDHFAISFVPIPERWPLVFAMLIGTSAFFLADEALTRGRDAPPLAYPLTKLCFLISIAIAIALDLERLFFLIIIVPVILVFFVVFGLFSRWTFRSTRHPWVGGLANAIVFAWAIATTFPMVRT